jgi:hypothetical protein
MAAKKEVVTARNVSILSVVFDKKITNVRNQLTISSVKPEKLSSAFDQPSPILRVNRRVKLAAKCVC